MSIKSELTKTTSYLRSARRAILGRGGEISATAGLKDLPEAIYKIPADASLAYRSDDSVAYRKVVPSGAEEYAQVAKVGGMTHKIEPELYYLFDTAVTELVSEGANLLPRAWIDRQVINGITYTVMDDNTIVANGTATAESNFSILRGKQVNEFITLEKGETYTLSGCPKGASNSTYRITVQEINYRQNYDDYGDGITAVAKYTGYYAYIRIFKGYTANNLVFKPMFVRGSTVKPYSPYGTIVDTFPISAELRAFLADKGYGKGVNADYYNYIDFDRKVFVQRVKEVDMGLLNWGYRLNNNLHIFNADLSAYGIQGQTSPDIPINALSADYRAVTVNATWVDRDMSYNSNILGIQTIEIVDNRYTNQTDFKAAVSGKKLLFAVETPIEIDISAYLTDDNFIKVEGGGTIKAVNEHEQDAPSTINYIEKVG